MWPWSPLRGPCEWSAAVSPDEVKEEEADSAEEAEEDRIGVDGVISTASNSLLRPDRGLRAK